MQCVICLQSSKAFMCEGTVIYFCSFNSSFVLRDRVAIDKVINTVLLLQTKLEFISNKKIPILNNILGFFFHNSNT